MTAIRNATGNGPIGNGSTRGVCVGCARIGGRAIEIVEARTTRWLFDRAKRRFLRLPRATDLDVGVLALDWQPYTDLSLDDDGVVVTLDGEGRLRLHAIPDEVGTRP